MCRVYYLLIFIIGYAVGFGMGYLWGRVTTYANQCNPFPPECNMQEGSNPERHNTSTMWGND